MPKGQYDRAAIVEKRERERQIMLGIIKPPSQILEARSNNETDEQISARIRERFRIMDKLTDTVIVGASRAMIVAGPPGLGKSYNIEKKLEEYSPDGKAYAAIKGFARATGLYRKLYENREPGQVVVFDDSDSIFNDENSLNLLKAACDTTETRWISWLAETTMITEEGDAMPTSFKFEGSVIFITNYDFDDKITEGGRLAEHLTALMSRAHYLNLAMRTRRDYMIRVKQVIDEGLFDTIYGNEKGLTSNQVDDVYNYMDANKDSLREVSLRMAIKIGLFRRDDDADWEMMSNITCLKEVI